MGCCSSKEQQQNDLYIDVPRDVSTTDKWVLREKSFVGGCKLLPFTAACPASYPYQALTRVVLGEDHLFAAVWEGVGGAQAARHCVAACYETLLQCLQSNSDPCWALRQTTRLLDEAFFNSDLPDTVKAAVGATGLMLFLNTCTNHCYVGRMGEAQPFVAAAQGSFNTISIDVRSLSIPSKSHQASPAAGTSSSRPLSSAGGATGRASPSAAAAAAAAAHEAAATAAASPAHAVGLGYGKHKKLQELWLKQQPGAVALQQQRQQRQLPFISNECEVGMSQLAPGDETLVLAGEGLMQLLAPQEVGMLLHHFNAGRLNQLKQAFTAAAPQQEGRATPAAAAPGRAAARRGSGGDDGTAASSSAENAVAVAGKLSRHTNVANLVVHQALSKALEQHNALQAGQQQPALSYEQLVALPLEVDVEAFRPPGAAGSGLRLVLPDGQQQAGGRLRRRDVHGDLGLVVLCLSRPGSDGGLPVVAPSRSGRAVSRPDAQYRWQLLRLAVKCRVAYRRSLRRRWWQLVDDVGRAALAAARQAEVQAWRDRGAAVKVNLMGDVLQPDEAGVRAIRHSPAHKLAAAPAAAAATAQQSPSPAAAKKRPQLQQGSPTVSPAAREPLGMRGSGGGSSSSSSKADPTCSPHLGAQRSSGGGGSASRSKRPAPVVVTPLAAAIGSAGAAQPPPPQQEAASDIESPSRLDSPSKAAAAAAAQHSLRGWAGSPRKKGAASPTKPAHGNLSLRSSSSSAARPAALADKFAAAEAPLATTTAPAAGSRDGGAAVMARARPTAGMIGAARGGAGELGGSGQAAAAWQAASSPAKAGGGGGGSPTKGGHSLRGGGSAAGSPSKISLRAAR